MGNDKVVSLAAPAVVEDALTELLRTGARRLIEAAVAAEFEECLSGFADERLPDGRRRVVRNGHLPRREILTGIGAVEVEVPKLRSRSGSSAPFRSSLVPPYVRRSASLDAAVPWLYLHGVSTGRMRAAVSALVGEEAARGLSANVVSRLKRSWDEEYRSWCRRSLADDWVYVWADGIHSGLRGAGERLCVLVVIGVNARGEKHFLAIEDGVRESTQSWREVLLGMKQRGFARPAKLAVGDGALGFWSALSEVYPQTRAQRCWMHKTGNVLNYLPKSSQPKAKQGAARDLDGRDQGTGRARLRRLARALRRQVSEGDRLPSPGSAGAAGLLRLPGRPLDAPAHDQRDRVVVRHHPPPQQTGEGLRQPSEHAVDDLQDGHVRREILATTTRLSAARQGDRGSEIQRRHRGRRGQQSRRMTNSTYTRFDYSSGSSFDQLMRTEGGPAITVPG